MKTILIATDFSEVSDNAMNYAVAIGWEFDSTIRLVHAYHTIPANPEISTKRHKEELEELRSKAEKNLQKRCEEIREKVKLNCDYIIEEGYARELIVDQVNEIQPDLLVMGAESMHPIDRIVFGTVTGNVLKKVSCPLLIVPQEASFQVPKKIGFALDYHDNDLQNMQLLIQWASKFKSDLNVLRVASPKSDLQFEDRLMQGFRERVDREIAGNKVVWYLIEGNRITAELEKFVEEHSIDLLAAVKSEMNFLVKTFFGSVTQRLFYHTRIPLLIFQSEDEEFRSLKLSKATKYE